MLFSFTIQGQDDGVNSCAFSKKLEKGRGVIGFYGVYAIRLRDEYMEVRRSKLKIINPALIRHQ